ncbi:conserved protein of unknown function [Denitratisoma oestradiolicum]|uniref:Agglutinin biogenesis protein MshI n=1 Tax=Denitratisoma oestradiolicum TaxID=311182 RepID=A0A6S6YIN7_9PROT|nr:conserved protein of unknown function [Denitratisoma oestradiolicum]
MVFRSQGVEVARVRRRTDGLPQVLAWDAFGETGSRPDVLKRLRSSRRLGGGDRCTTLLGHGQYQLFQMEAPSVPAEERRDALRWRIKEMVSFPVDQAGIDVLDIPGAPDSGGRAAQVYVVAAGNEVLAPVVQDFQQARLPLVAIDIPELAQRNIATLFEEPNRGLALLVFDATGGCLTFTYQGELYVTRRIEATADELMRAGKGSESLHERVLLDVQRSLDNFDRNYSFITLSRLLVAPLSGAEAFIEFLRENLFQTVEVMDLAQGLDLAAVPVLAEPGRQSEALLAIGAALREDA